MLGWESFEPSRRCVWMSNMCDDLRRVALSQFRPSSEAVMLFGLKAGLGGVLMILMLLSFDVIKLKQPLLFYKPTFLTALDLFSWSTLLSYLVAGSPYFFKSLSCTLSIKSYLAFACRLRKVGDSALSSFGDSLSGLLFRGIPETIMGKTLVYSCCLVWWWFECYCILWSWVTLLWFLERLLCDCWSLSRETANGFSMKANSCIRMEFLSPF